MEKIRRNNRMMLSLSDSEKAMLVFAAKVLGETPAAAARKMIVTYMSEHKNDFEVANRAADAYRVSIEKLTRQPSLFSEDNT